MGHSINKGNLSIYMGHPINKGNLSIYMGHSINKEDFFEKRKINVFEKFFHRCKLWIVWNWFMEKNYFNLAKWQKIKEGAPSLNRGLLSTFWLLRNANNVKFTKECMLCLGKYVLLQNVFTNCLNMSLSQWAWVKKTVYRVETHWKKFWV